MEKIDPKTGVADRRVAHPDDVISLTADAADYLRELDRKAKNATRLAGKSTKQVGARAA